MKNKLKYSFALFGILSVLTFRCIAQNVQVTAHIDSSNIRIGEQIHLHLIASYDAKSGLAKIQWPAISDSLVSKVRVVSKSKIDTIIPDSAHPTLLEQKQDLLITSFDSGYYAIPPFTFIVNGDTAHPQQTEPIMLQVHTVAVDTTKGIKDIKGPQGAPFSILEALPWIILGFAILGVLALLIYFIARAVQKKPAPVIITAPPIDPHIKALNALEELSAKKLWQEGKIKEYHSTISDVLRIYIDERFRINAPEMITSEIVQAMRRVDIDEELKTKLKQTLLLADLVKFAKEQPLPHEHEQCLNSAIEFVKRTVPEAKTPEPVKPRESQQAQTESQKTPFGQ